MFGQILHGFKKDTSYILTLSAAQCGLKSANKQVIQVMLNDQTVGVFTPESTEFTKFSTGPFTTKDGDQILRIAGTNALGDNIALIDAVQIHAVSGR